MIKILFLIHDLGQGGAEKVLVNLVNNMDRTKFDISVTTLFGGGVNEQFLASDIHFRAVWNKEFPGNSKLMKIFSPEILHKICIKEEYDIEISYLEGPSARIISGCKNPNTKLISWIHVEQQTMDVLSTSFRNREEAIKCYNRFDKVICVSESVRKDFCKILNYNKPCSVLYNTIESEFILQKAKEQTDLLVNNEEIRLVAVGTLKKSKGYERLLNIVDRLIKEHYQIHLYILGEGPFYKDLEDLVEKKHLTQNVTFLGYHTNPYKYLAMADLFVCSSFSEGFSTATTEALILGIPVCTVEVSGMKEMLGEDNEYGIVTENSEEALYLGIKKLLDSSDLLKKYTERAKERGKLFSTQKTVMDTELMLEGLIR